MDQKPEKCNICGASNWKNVYEDVPGFGIDRAFTIHRCTECGTTATANPLRGKDLKDYYDTQAVAFNGKGDDELVDSYLKNREDYWYKLGYYDRLAEIRRVAPNAKTILDIGCAAGFFLDCCREHGYETYGLEISSWGYGIATGKLKLTVLKKHISELKKGEIPAIDVVTMYDILEHTENPRSDLSEIKGVMKDGGTIIINLPNLDSFISKVTGAQWNKLIPPNHTYFFTQPTLRKLVEGVGFSFVYAKTNNGTAREFAAELGTSIWRLLGVVFPPAAKAYASKDLPFSKNRSLLVAAVKVTKTVFGYLGFLVVPVMPILTLLKKGEGLHLVAEKK